MKKCTTIVICALMVLSLVGCGSRQTKGDSTIQIGNVMYYNTQEVVPVEPPESKIVYVRSNGNTESAKDTISAYVFINEDTIEGEFLVALIDGQWYKFLPK